MRPAILATLACVYLLAGLIGFAARTPGYRHGGHTISELGERGAPMERPVAWGFFFPLGILLLAVAFLLRPLQPAPAALSLCIAVGYLGAALFPCDPGSPLSGTPTQALHNLAGGVEYIGGGLALLRLGAEQGRPFQIAGSLVLITALALSLPALRSFRGAAQRIGEACLFGGLTWAAWSLRLSS